MYNRDFGDTADPVCIIEVLGQKKSTMIHKDSLNVLFDERITYNFENLDPKKLIQGKISIEVYDSNMIRSNKLIGSFEFDLQTIYYCEHHELYQQWIGLTDVTDANEGVQGYLQVTVVVLGPNDEQYIHSESEETFGIKAGTDMKLLNVLMPPQIEQRGYNLNFNVWLAEKLVALDTLSKTSDPYVK